MAGIQSGPEMRNTIIIRKAGHGFLKIWLLLPFAYLLNTVSQVLTREANRSWTPTTNNWRRVGVGVNSTHTIHTETLLRRAVRELDWRKARAVRELQDWRKARAVTWQSRPRRVTDGGTG